jgi:hypothetical protein
VYIFDFGGYVNALDLQTGKIDWTYVPPSEGYDTPYGIAPIWSFGTPSVADGKLFLSASHMYNPPMFSGAKRLVINATDGSLVWSIMSFDGRCPGAIADGFLVTWNSFDKQIYTYGKGQTATTASIQNDIVTYGSDVLIRAGLPTNPQAHSNQHSKHSSQKEYRVSEESMTHWMEYVYMRQPKPTNNRCPSNIKRYDSNGNYRNRHNNYQRRRILSSIDPRHISNTPCMPHAAAANHTGIIL